MELNLKIPHLSLTDYIFYYSSKFKLAPSQIIKALQIANETTKRCNMSGKKISGYAAAIIKYVTGETYDGLAKKMNVVSTTICARFNEIKKIMK
jgi:transcription initiation factor TFIIIB Brf1 subunit/transcription initiation factor TFIIB